MCAEHLAEGVVVDTHKVAIENQSIGMQILELTNSRTRETSEGIFALQEKLDEVLKLRETLERGIDALKLERKLNAIEAKNGYLQFFQEYSSQSTQTSSRSNSSLVDRAKLSNVRTNPRVFSILADELRGGEEAHQRRIHAQSAAERVAQHLRCPLPMA